MLHFRINFTGFLIFDFFKQKKHLAGLQDVLAKLNKQRTMFL